MADTKLFMTVFFSLIASVIGLQNEKLGFCKETTINCLGDTFAWRVYYSWWIGKMAGLLIGRS